MGVGEDVGVRVGDGPGVGRGVWVGGRVWDGVRVGRRVGVGDRVGEGATVSSTDMALMEGSPAEAVMTIMIWVGGEVTAMLKEEV